MSQILRFTKNLKGKTLLHNGTHVSIFCKACQKLRNGLSNSANPNLKPIQAAQVFKKKRWKQRETLYKKLTQCLDARQAQLASLSGNLKLSHRGELPVLMQGNQTRRCCQVEQSVHYVGSSLYTQQMDRLEKQTELLKGQKSETVPETEEHLSDRKLLTSKYIHKSGKKIKTSDFKSGSAVIHKPSKELKAKSVISDTAEDGMPNVNPVISDTGFDISQTNRTQTVRRDKLKHSPSVRVESPHPQKLDKKHMSKLPLHHLDTRGIQEIWKNGSSKDVLIDEKRKVPLRYEQTDLNVFNSKKKHKKRKKDMNVVSKPVHVKNVPMGKTAKLTAPVLKNTTVSETPEISSDLNEDNVADLKDTPNTGSLKGAKSKKGSEAKHKQKKKPNDLKEQDKHTHKKVASKVSDWNAYSLEGQINIFNQDLKSYVEACCFNGWDKHAIGAIQHYREQRHAGVEKFQIRDIEIYNCIIRCLAEKGDLSGIVELSSMIYADGLKPNLWTYALSLYCLDQKRDADPLVAQYIVKDMEKEGLNVKDIFTQLKFVGNEKQSILKVLHKVFPGFEIPSSDPSHSYSGLLVKELNNPLPKSEMVEANPYAGVISAEEILEKADEQFTKELETYASVKSVATVSDETLTEQKKKQLKEKLKKLKKSWRLQLTEGFRSKLRKMEKRFYATNNMNLYPYLKLFPEEVYIDFLMKEIEHLESTSEFYSPATSVLYMSLGQKLLDRFNMQQKADRHIIPKLKQVFTKYTEKMMDPNIENLNHRLCWMKIQKELYGDMSLEVEEKDWSFFIKKAIGKLLFEIIISEVKIPAAGKGAAVKKMEPAFYTVIRNKERTTLEEIKPHPEFLKLMSCEDNIVFHVSELPLLVPPLPWLSPTQGVNFLNTGKTIRRCVDRQLSMFKSAPDTGPIFDSLNILGACPWRVNKPILDLIIHVFNSGGNDAVDIPILPSSIEKPQKPKGKMKMKEWLPVFKERIAYKKSLYEANSLWHGALYKFSIANMFRDEIFWFPHNMDFRGRTYAIPPHFNHLGGDTSRAIIQFAKGKPLGPNGLNWLKIHLINLTGLKKKSSQSERLAYANEIMEDILDSADNPLNGKKWWASSEEPWQTLACCFEIAAASRSEDPSAFVSHFPVHQDGSCNGLQHYAALGRDTAGAKSVNLRPFDKPSDVYQDVVDLVEKKRQRDLLEGDEKIKKVAKLCEGHMERKVIKQTVMTTVYGVTRFGSRLQIAKQLKERGMSREDIFQARAYLSDSTFYCLSQMFVSARQIQEWFDACAITICNTHHKPVEWVTPLNFPVVQPYFKSLQSCSYGVSASSSRQEHGIVSTMKQKNAFAPNYIHSLDSTHMMLTSLFCSRAGITFVSVHDCFWTHACDVEIMNKVTREQFVSLHSQPILENLSDYFMKTFCDTPVIDPKPNSPEDLSVKSDLKAEIAGNLSESASQLHTTNELEMDKSENAISGMEIYESDSTHIGTTDLNLSADLEHNQSNNASADFDVNLSADLEHNQSFNASGDIDISLSADLEYNHSYNASGDFDVNGVEIGAELVVSKSETPSVIKLDYTRKYPKKKITEREKMTHLKKVLTSIPERGDFDLTEVIKSTYFFS